MYGSFIRYAGNEKPVNIFQPIKITNFHSGLTLKFLTHKFPHTISKPKLNNLPIKLIILIKIYKSVVETVVKLYGLLDKIVDHDFHWDSIEMH